MKSAKCSFAITLSRSSWAVATTSITGNTRLIKGLEKYVSVLNVDAALDMHRRRSAYTSEYHIHQILVHEPNYLFNYSHLAYQSYLTSPDALAVLEGLHFDAYRIGQMRENMEEIEPVIRQADMMSFDVGAIRMQDAPGNFHVHPFGLTGEEACQLCWYAGLNEKMTSVGFYEYNPELDVRGQTAVGDRHNDLVFCGRIL